MPPPPHHPTHHHGGGGGGHGGLPGRGNSGAQYIGLEMLVPKQYLGNVIGKAGKYINAVRQQYGVDLRVVDFDPQRNAVYAPPDGVECDWPANALLSLCSSCRLNTQ